MTLTEAMLIVVFVIPMITLSAAGIAEARRQMRLEAARAYVRRQARMALMHEAARRRARGTPQRRPGGYEFR